MNRERKSQRQLRRGAITILAALLSIVMVGMVAFCVDIGYVLSAKEEMQRTADSSAMAACWEFAQQISDGNDEAVAAGLARVTVTEYANQNAVTGAGMSVNPNSGNDPAGDIVFGTVTDFNSTQDTFTTGNPSSYNAVRVRIHKDSSANGEVPYFFARVFGLDGQVLHSEATAAILRQIGGFQARSDGQNVDILPFALDIDTWNELTSGNGDDNYYWNEESESITSGSDGWVEVNLFPQGTGSPGNRGTVDIGGSNNSTSDLARQILEGISPSDFAALGKPLVFDGTGKLTLNGDTGISAGVKDELALIKGEPRVIPIFQSVTGNGNNAEYTIVKWQGIRIMYVKLTGSMSQKKLMIQVAPVSTPGVVASTTAEPGDHVFSPVVLVK
jgi:Flp pilus assembly protein TadG